MRSTRLVRIGSRCAVAALGTGLLLVGGAGTSAAADTPLPIPALPTPPLPIPGLPSLATADGPLPALPALPTPPLPIPGLPSAS